MVRWKKRLVEYRRCIFLRLRGAVETLGPAIIIIV